MALNLSTGTLQTMAGIFAPAKKKRAGSGGGSGGGASGGGKAGSAFVRSALPAAAAARSDRVSVAFGSGGHARQSARAIDTLKRTARGAPEVMVKVTGRQSGAAHVLANFSYVARLGHGEDKEIGLLTDDGRELKDARDMQALARDWHDFEIGDDARRKGSTSISMILSMPAGTDPDKVREAAIAFAGEAMENRRWILALHNDRDHPHVHLTIARRDRDGQRFHPNRDDLFRYRQIFAEKLRDHGIEANATPARARGIEPKGERIAVRKLRDQNIPLRIDSRRQARLETLKAQGIPDPARERLAQDQALIRSVYSRSIAELETSNDPEGAAIAKSLSAFLAAMPARNPRSAERAEPRSDEPSDPVAQALARARQARGQSVGEAPAPTDALNKVAPVQETTLERMQRMVEESDTRGRATTEKLDRTLEQVRDRDRQKDKDRDRGGPGR